MDIIWALLAVGAGLLALCTYLAYRALPGLLWLSTAFAAAAATSWQGKSPHVGFLAATLLLFVHIVNRVPVRA